MRWALAGLTGLLTLPGVAVAAEDAALDLPLWSVTPFGLLLLAIAVLPLVAGHFWHSNWNKGLVSLLLSGPVAVYLLLLGTEAQHALGHELEQYVSFMLLLGSLYTVSGGIVLEGDLEARPLTNTAFLAFGAMLANFIGTTGASMLLIRPVLRTNRQRQHTAHLPIFFIFTVSNLGGLLTPLGDPPLFLGFLNGVDFFWTLSLWPQWLLTNGIVLLLFLICDTLAYRRETREAILLDITQVQPLRVRGLINLVFLAGILLAVLLRSEQVGMLAGQAISGWLPVTDLTLSRPWGEVVLVVMSVLSLALTPRGLRAANAFGWGAITEVAVLFLGIFITMVPALHVLRVQGPQFGVTEPWQYFWLTGILSSFLDNAPTYLTLASVAAGPHDFAWLAQHNAPVLEAISCGAVFMGANTYIGNGPNFMVKAIADESGLRTPSFLGYLLYSSLILLPIFGLVTFLFFAP